MKGQRSRSGFSGMTGFEGGQLPLIRRIPKRGFRHSAFRPLVAVVNVGDLGSRIGDRATVSPEVLRELGMIKKNEKLKVLGDGELKKALTVQAHAFSASAKAKIEKAGGRAELMKI
jgi:large subunit ribosomal protein L15